MTFKLLLSIEIWILFKNFLVDLTIAFSEHMWNFFQTVETPPPVGRYTKDIETIRSASSESICTKQIAYCRSESYKKATTPKESQEQYHKEV